jgi:hypothetical protein
MEKRVCRNEIHELSLADLEGAAEFAMEVRQILRIEWNHGRSISGLTCPVCGQPEPKGFASLRCLTFNLEVNAPVCFDHAEVIADWLQIRLDLLRNKAWRARNAAR